jgi:hypothetical protein
VLRILSYKIVRVVHYNKGEVCRVLSFNRILPEQDLAPLSFGLFHYWNLFARILYLLWHETYFSLFAKSEFELELIQVVSSVILLSPKKNKS